MQLPNRRRDRRPLSCRNRLLRRDFHSQRAGCRRRRRHAPRPKAAAIVTRAPWSRPPRQRPCRYDVEVCRFQLSARNAALDTTLVEPPWRAALALHGKNTELSPLWNDGVRAEKSQKGPLNGALANDYESSNPSKPRERYAPFFIFVPGQECGHLAHDFIRRHFRLPKLANDLGLTKFGTEP